MAVMQLAFGLLVVVATTVTTSSEGTKNLEWKNHYDSAKRTAQAVKRPLVVVIEDDKEKIDEDSLRGKSERILLQERFQLVRVDANTAYGRKVALAFGAKKLPYTAVTDEQSQRIVFRKAGPMSKSDWTLALAESVKTQGDTVSTSVETHVYAAPNSSAASVNVEYPVYSAPQPVFADPVMTHQPIISSEMFAPNGLYVMPIGAQCVT